MSSPATLLPCRNAQVLHPPCTFADIIDPAAVARTIAAHLAGFDVTPDRRDIVLAFRWQGLPEYPRLRGLADGIAAGMQPHLANAAPLRIIVDGDIARSLGAILKEELHIPNDLLVLDGIALSDFDFIDLGRMRLPSETVPVTIKTLVFRDDPMQKQTSRKSRARPAR